MKLTWRDTTFLLNIYSVMCKVHCIFLLRLLLCNCLNSNVCFFFFLMVHFDGQWLTFFIGCMRRNENIFAHRFIETPTCFGFFSFCRRGLSRWSWRWEVYVKCSIFYGHTTLLCFAGQAPKTWCGVIEPLRFFSLQPNEPSIWDLRTIWEPVTSGDARVLISADPPPAFITLMPPQFMENPGL